LIPFTTEQFLQVFQSYNQAVYPLQWILFFLAVAAVFLALKPGSFSNRVIAALLASLWLWMGVAYHLFFFTHINVAAYLFGFLCVIQALILFISGVIRRELNFSPRLNTSGIVGGVLITYALIIYPVLGYIFGHVYPQSPTFGTPCPTTIYTFGLLLWTQGRTPLQVLIIPFTWSLIGFTAALILGIREDTGLLVASILGTSLIVWKNKASQERRA
jgi:hypothetical protein